MRELLDEALGELAWGEKIDAAARQLIVTHANKVLEVNKTMNLTRITEPAEMVQRHMIDSLWVVEALSAWGHDAPQNFLDMGSGGGWPFVPMKAVWRKSEGWAAEKSLKKAKFLKDFCDEVLPRADVWNKQARELPQRRYDLITSRAVGSLAYVFTETHHAIRPDGLLVVFKGPNVDDELDAWQVLCENNEFEQLPPVGFSLKDGSERYLIAARKTAK